MKFWTVQTKEVIQMIKNDGIYKPDFSKSYWIQNHRYKHSLKLLYDLVLESFNKNNNMNLSGLIFGFAVGYNKPLYEKDNKGIVQKINPGVFEIADIKFFHYLIQIEKTAINHLWNELVNRDVSIIELNYEETFNPIFIDINDWQFLMPPISESLYYTFEDAKRLYYDIEHGIIEESNYPSYIIQAHLPYIKAENIVNIYPMFDLK